MVTDMRSADELERALAAADDARAHALALTSELALLRRQAEEIRAGFATEQAVLRRQLEGLRSTLAEREAVLAVTGQVPPPAMGATEPLQAAFEAAPLGMALSDPASRRLLRANACFRRMLGHAKSGMPEGAGLLDVIHPEDRDAAEAALRSLEAGHGPLSAELRCLRREGDPVDVRVEGVLVPGPPALLFLLFHDLTEQRAAAERQMLLAREMDHRAKNMLAILQSVVRLTRAPDLKGYMQAIEGRIGAVARAHSLLSGDRFRGAQLRRLVEEELAPFAGAPSDRIRIAGPDLPLAPQAVQCLAMALHEMATNAAKYGALSVPAGTLAVTWEVLHAEDLLRLRWVEGGGPPVPCDAGRRGFGSRLIQATIEEQLGGWVVKDWNREGLRCEIGIPARRSIIAAA
jgi:PAS domain S-box-containing protein